MLIDTHAHIYLEDFKSDIEEVIQRAQAEGVKKILLPNIDKTSIDDMLGLEEKYPGECYAMMGLHPCSIKKDVEKELYEVETWLTKREFLAIGEIGTDLHWDNSFWEQQKNAFNCQCELAIQYDLPVVIHCRDSIDETIELVKKFEGRNLRGVFHCFTGSKEQGNIISEMGFYLGIGGVSTFKNGGLGEVIPSLDRDKLILETDSPYLSPVPYRGRRNEPSRITLVADKVAEFLDMSFEEVSFLTTKNSNDLFFRP